MGLFEGKKGLILGVANDRSIAWAIAEKIMAEGGECGFTHLPDREDDDKKKNRRRVEKCFENSESGGQPKFLIPLNVQGNEKPWLVSGFQFVETLFDATAVFLLFIVFPVRKVGESALAPLGHDFFRDRPSNGTIICHTENQTFFAFEQTHQVVPFSIRLLERFKMTTLLFG